jgi:hypothetical protein
MDHNESIRKFERLMESEANHARDAAIELAALVPFLPSEKSRQFAQAQAEGGRKRAKEFRELKSKRPRVSSAGSVGWEASRVEPHSAASCALAERPRLRRRIG